MFAAIRSPVAMAFSPRSNHRGFVEGEVKEGVALLEHPLRDLTIAASLKGGLGGVGNDGVATLRDLTIAASLKGRTDVLILHGLTASPRSNHLVFVEGQMWRWRRGW